MRTQSAHWKSMGAAVATTEGELPFSLASLFRSGILTIFCRSTSLQNCKKQEKRCLSLVSVSHLEFLSVLRGLIRCLWYSQKSCELTGCTISTTSMDYSVSRSRILSLSNISRVKCLYRESISWTVLFQACSPFDSIVSEDVYDADTLLVFMHDLYVPVRSQRA